MIKKLFHNTSEFFLKSIAATCDTTVMTSRNKNYRRPKSYEEHVQPKTTIFV